MKFTKQECPKKSAYLTENDAGRRIHIRKGTLRGWREDFATELRARGIEANATSRAERGQPYKSKGGTEWHIQKRALATGAAPSEALAKRLAAAGKELEEGRTELRPWEIAMEARRRDVLRDLSKNASTLRQEGDVELAEQIDRFMADMPALDTERRQMQRALLKQVQERMRQWLVEKDPDRGN